MRYFSLVFILPIVLLSRLRASKRRRAPCRARPPHNPPTSISPAATFKLIYSFKGKPDGERPEARLAFLDGAFYGTTQFGGTDDVRRDLRSQARRHRKGAAQFLSRPDGDSPITGLVPRGASLFGATQAAGRISAGRFYEIKRDGTLKILYNFTTPPAAIPSANCSASAASFYGVTGSGGAHDLGAVYSITAEGHYTLIHSFGGGDDGAPL